jgi:predicted esterase
VTTEHHIVVQRTARYVTIGETSAATTELWIVCHGYGQLARPFVASFEAIASPSRLIVAPEALSRFYLERSATGVNTQAAIGATWMTREDREHEIVDQIAYLDALHDHVRPAGNPHRVRLRVLGFSQGVATVGRWIARGRAHVDELIVWAGAFPPDVDLTVLRDRLAGAPVVFVVGERDELAPWAAADAQLQRFTDAGIQARLVVFEGGHRLDYGTLAALAEE